MLLGVQKKKAFPNATNCYRKHCKLLISIKLQQLCSDYKFSILRENQHEEPCNDS